MLQAHCVLLGLQLAGRHCAEQALGCLFSGWHADACLGHVHDRSRVVCLGVAVLVSTGEAVKEELALVLMKNVFPHWSGKDALRALHSAFLEENAEADEELDIEEDMLQEVVAPSDVKDVRKSCADLKTARARKEAAALKRPDTVARDFTFNAPPKSRKQSAKPAPRWLPGRNPKAADATYFIQKYAPPHSHVWGG